jgi:quinol monooxygenase YgiN
MIHKMVRFTVQADQIAAVEEVIREFVEAVAENEPETTYRAYRRGDSRAFVHVMAFPDAKAEARHRDAPHTRRFVERLYPKCEKEPEFEELVSIS